MKNEQHKCLFDYWQQNSAPMFHSSRFWPQVNEADIASFLGAPQVPATLPVTPVDLAELRSYKQKIESFLQFAGAQTDYDAECAKQYMLFEQERLVVLDIILGAYNGNTVAAQNEQLYGNFSDLLAEECCNYIAQAVAQYAPSNELGQRAKAYVQSYLPASGSAQKVASVFSAFELVKSKTQPVVEAAFSFVNDLDLPDSSTAVQVQQLLEDALQRMLPGSGWSARCVNGAPNAHIDYDTKSIVLPQGRMFSKDHVKSLIVHEIGVHVVRSHNGFLTHEKLSGYGLVGYGHVEEAMGVLLENAFTRTASSIMSLVPTAALYVCIKQSFSFGDMYSFLLQLLICLKGDASLRDDTPLKRAAFSRAIRMMRFGNSAVVDYSSTKYWRGMIELSTTYTTLNQRAIDEFMIAKYDTKNITQKQLLLA